MTSEKQFEANRRNASRSTGPRTPDGKHRSSRNAVRHGLTAETVIVELEDRDDYDAFQAAVISDYDAESAVEREMVLRLASILWRLRRATGIETSLFNFAARETNQKDEPSEPVQVAGLLEHQTNGSEPNADDVAWFSGGLGAHDNIANSYLRLIALPTFPLDRLTRYEHILWRQARQIIFTLETLRRRKPLPSRASFPFTFRASSR